MKTFKVGDKVKIPKKSNSDLTNFKDFLEEISNYKLDYLIVNKISDKTRSWQVSLERDDKLTLLDDAFMFEDLEHYEEPNQITSELSGLLIDFDKVETIEEAAENYAKSENLSVFKKSTHHDYDVQGFTTGAKSDAARNYWFKIFQEEQNKQ